MAKKNKIKVKPEAAAADSSATSAKRDAVMGGPSKKESKGNLVGVVVALVAVAVIGFVMFGGGGADGMFQVVKAEAGQIKIPVSKVNDGQAHYYTYKAPGKDVNFFILKSADGTIRAAFDACDVCFREKKGYRQEGDTMVCNNCGQRFPADKINVVKGGCNPAPINRNIEGDYLVLNAKEVESGTYYF